jgi:hypothetical protein
MWVKLSKKGLFEPKNIIKFKDFELIYLNGFANLIHFLINNFLKLPI